MPGIAFTEFCRFPAAPPAAGWQRWNVALESFGEGNVLRLVATGRWRPLNGLPECGPDGLDGVSYDSDRLVMAEAPVGALIGRFGGSSASFKSAEGAEKPFAVGRHCVVRVPAGGVGPLFLGFNVLTPPFEVGALLVVISTGRGEVVAAKAG